MPTGLGSMLMAGAMLGVAGLRRRVPVGEVPGEIKPGPGVRPPSSKSKRIEARRAAQQAAWEARAAKRQAMRGAGGGCKPPAMSGKEER